MARAERTVVGFDTEDDGNGNPFLWCFTWGGGRTHFKSRHDALAWLERFALDEKGEGRKLELWATNLEYDLVNLFPRDRIAELNFRFGRSFLCGAGWRNVDLRDTVRHLPASVAELGEMVGLKKAEADLFDRQDKTPEAFLRRCMTDSAITYRAAKSFHEAYAEFGEHPRMTLASTALSIWRERYWKKPTRKVTDEVWALAFEAYHGGRTQSFNVGEFHDVTVADVASMYPWAMTCAPLPVPWGLQGRVRAGDPVQAFGVYDVTVDSQLELPRLPYRGEERTIYPNGRWRGCYVGEELLAFQRAGGRVKVHGGVLFQESCEPFTEYVGHMFKLKQGARGINRTMYKLLLNSLYGKFAQRGRVVKVTTADRFLNMRPIPLEAREWHGLVIYNHDGPNPPWSNAVWPAFVTARARVRLADTIAGLEARGQRVLYCDTDSVMHTGPKAFPDRARRIGEFETRGRYQDALLVGRKEYALRQAGQDWECHAKGVPAAERFGYLTEGRASFYRPSRLRESIRDGSTPNAWRSVTKQRRTKLAGRSSDGRLPHPTVG